MGGGEGCCPANDDNECISFLLLLWQNMANFMARNSAHLLSYSCGHQRMTWVLGWNQVVGRAVFFLEDIEEYLFSCLFPVSRSHSRWPLAPFLLQSQQWLTESLSHCITLTFTLLSHFKNYCDYTEHIHIIQDNLFISRSTD